MMNFACLVVVSLITCNDFSRQGRLVAWRGRGRGQLVVSMWGYPYWPAERRRKRCQTDGGRATRQCFVGLNSRRQKDQRFLWALCTLFLCYHVSNIPYPCLKHTQSPSQPSVTHRTCSSVTLSPISSNLFTCLLVHLLTRLVTLSPVSSNLFTCLLVHLLTCLVTLS